MSTEAPEETEGYTVKEWVANVLLILGLIAFAALMVYRFGEVHRYLAHYPK